MPSVCRVGTVKRYKFLIIGWCIIINNIIPIFSEQGGDKFHILLQEIASAEIDYVAYFENCGRVQLEQTANPFTLTGRTPSKFSLALCCSRKYPYPSHGRFFKLHPPYPSRNSILVSHFRPKNWAFETPLPLGISTDLPWGGHGYFLELHIVNSYVHSSNVCFCSHVKLLCTLECLWTSYSFFQLDEVEEGSEKGDKWRFWLF